MSQLVIQTGAMREISMNRAIKFLAALSPEKRWLVTVEQHKARRSLEQNAYLFGVVYRTILESEALQGWTLADVHDYFLGEAFGWETIKGFGRKRLRPIRRSSRLNKQEFSDFIAFIQQRMAEHGLYIPDPNEAAA
jgi:hypothetical protein